MLVSLFCNQTVQHFSLPEKAAGRYPFFVGTQKKLVGCFEGTSEGWRICLEPGFRYKEYRNQSDVLLQPLHIYLLEDVTGFPLFLFTEALTEDRQKFVKYCICKPGEISIGRNRENGIVLQNRFISSNHARLICGAHEWVLEDLESVNGVYVNGRRIKKSRISCGDTIYLMGCRILVGSFFLAINNPDNSVEIRSPLLCVYEPQQIGKESKYHSEAVEEPLFFCSPHFRNTLEQTVIRVDSPPPLIQMQETPLFLSLGPALTMGMTSVVMAIVAYLNYYSGAAELINVVPTFFMAAAMLAGSLLWPMLSRRSDRKRYRDQAEMRLQKYRKYLDQIREQCFVVRQKQERILRENIPDLAELGRRVEEKDRMLWECSAYNSSFLTVRLGVGQLPAMLCLEGTSGRFSVEEDPLNADLSRLLEEPQYLQKVPVTRSLKEASVWGITGLKQQAQLFAASLAFQLAALHPYHELKLAFIVPQEAPWEFIRYLPHAWDGPSMRMTASTPQEVKALSFHLSAIVQERMNSENRTNGPWYVVFVTDKMLSDELTVLSLILPQAQKLRMAVIRVDELLRNLPRECTRVIQFNGKDAVLVDGGEQLENQIHFLPEMLPQNKLSVFSRRMSNILLADAEDRRKLPATVTLLELYGVGKCEHLNVVSRWQENNPIHSLQAPIGIGEDGEPIFLDLHESFHGPHGLIAGMTGSGKSEFIITYILSMAIQFSPDEVAFILIDYKGGGLAGAFENQKNGLRLPHLSGTITNLDGSAVKRSLIAIQSELRRRQRIFNEAREQTDEGTIDIYKYQRMYRSGQVSEPLPHLFIISDEFAELKAQQPEFMEQLISTARIGRSLGIHLILATQKPAGVVNDQIWSNSRFHVCLKVQQKEDSNEMIKRTDAAYLTDTGRFYLQVGFNELFVLGQSAWSGAPYVPANQPQVRRDESVEVLDGLGRTLAKAKPASAKLQASSTQVVAVVRYLAAMAAQEQKSAKPLWLPPLPDHLFIQSLCAQYHWKMPEESLSPAVGEIDDPSHQRKALFTLPLSQDGSVLILGMAGSGKTTLLQTILYQLLKSRMADRLSVYLVDLASESLRAFSAAPQVGGVLLAEHGERVETLFHLLEKEVTRRRKLFAEYGGMLHSYCAETGNAVSEILVVIHSYAAFAEQFADQEEALFRMIRDGARYGIYFIVTAGSVGAVRYRLLQSFGRIITLQMTDKTDYSTVFGNTEGVYPAQIPGRGLVYLEAPYEFQVAYAFSSLEDIRSFCTMQEEKAVCFAPSIPYLPERVDFTVFRSGQFDLSHFPVGISKKDLSPLCLNLTKQVAMRLMGQTSEAFRGVAEGFAETAQKLLNVNVQVWDADRIWKGSFSEGLSYHAEELETQVGLLFQEMVKRNNLYKEKPTNKGFADCLYVVTGYSRLLEMLTPDGVDKLRLLIQKAEPQYRIYFLICGTPREVSAMEKEDWYERQINLEYGIWVGKGILEQYKLNLSVKTNDLYQIPPKGFGYVVREGKAELVKLLQNSEEQEEQDE